MLFSLCNIFAWNGGIEREKKMQESDVIAHAEWFFSWSSSDT